MNVSFIDKLIDWKNFEIFVADMYRDSEQVIVEHNVTLTGKSNAKRQIDVRVTQKTKLHEYITIIECKRWKKPVTRQVIDVLFASVEDLNANKGVIFTTKGYEEGAIEYAKNKNIDIFIIRDIRDDEYGHTGKAFSLYLQMFNGKIENIDVPNPLWYSPLNLLPKSQPQMDILFTEKQTYPEHLHLVNLNGEKGENLLQLLIDIRTEILNKYIQSFNSLIEPKEDENELGLSTKVIVDFSNSQYKHLKHEGGFILFEKIIFDFYGSINQSKIDFDKTASVDFALIVENYISKQKNFISKHKNEDKIRLSNPIESSNFEKSELVNPNSTIKLALEHWVDFQLKDTTKIEKANDINIKILN